MAEKWDYVVTVASETEPGATYEIKRRGAQLACSCLHYRFARRTKTCKHLVAYLAGVPLVQMPGVRPETVTVTSDGETFTVTRRGISFSTDLR